MKIKPEITENKKQTIEWLTKPKHILWKADKKDKPLAVLIKRENKARKSTNEWFY